MNNLLISIGVLIVAILAALFAVPHYVDWNAYRGVIEEETSRVFGRDVRIGGKINLELLPTPSFVIHKLRVADVANVSGEPLFRADQVAAKLSIAPLLKGVLEANEIELVRPVLRLVLDEQGRGNWRNLGMAAGNLAFAPTDVALQSVKITDGVLQVLDGNGARERIALHALDGQLSAPALEGPYRFRGEYGAAPKRHELRFSTSRPSDNGDVQIKGSARSTAHGTTYALDGVVGGLSAKPSVSGELTAAWPIGGGGTAAKGELKADVVGDNHRVAFRNLSLAFESEGRPQVLAGEASVAWSDETSSIVRLSAPWLDLDAILGIKPATSPFMPLAAFAQSIAIAAGGVGAVDAVVDVDQANLGREAISGLHVLIRSAGDGLNIEALRANLPGAAQLNAQGRIAVSETGPAFIGDVLLEGRSMARAVAWATAGGLTVPPSSDRPLRLRGRLFSEASRVALTDATVDLGDGPIEGRAEYESAELSILSIVAQGARIDGRAIPGGLSLRTLAERLRHSGAAPSKLNVTLALRAGELTLADRVLRDVNVGLTRGVSQLAIDRLSFAADRGVAVSVTGLRTDAGELDLKGMIAADDQQGLATLADLLDVSNVQLPDAISPHVLPLQLAGSLIKRHVDAPMQLIADGRLGLANTKLRASFEAGSAGWRAAPVDGDLVLSSARDARIFETVLAWAQGVAAPERPVASAASLPEAPEARLAIRATGRAIDGLQTIARFDSPGATAHFDGRLRLAPDTAAEMSGALQVDARDGRDLLRASMGLDGLPALTGSATARVTLKGQNLILDDLAMSSNGATVQGRLKSDVGRPDQRRISGDLAFSSLDATVLLSSLLAPGAAVVETAQAAAGSTGWPGRLFQSMAATAAPNVQVLIKAETLLLPSSMTAQNAAFDFTQDNKGLSVLNLQGQALGGTLSGRLQLAPSAKGADLTAALAIKGAKLQGFEAPATADADLELTGAATSPALLMASLVGRGQLALGAADVREVTPASLLAAIELAMAAAPDKVTSSLRTQLANTGSRLPVALGPRRLSLAVQDSIARADALTVRLSEGAIVAQPQLDLTSGVLSGTWRIETALPPLQTQQPNVPPPKTVALPSVVRRFQVRLQEAAPAPRPALETEALEKELAVRKVERDLAELERLRRLDEERAAAVAREKAPQQLPDGARANDAKPAGAPANSP